MTEKENKNMNEDKNKQGHNPGGQYQNDSEQKDNGGQGESGNQGG